MTTPVPPEAITAADYAALNDAITAGQRAVRDVYSVGHLDGQVRVAVVAAAPRIVAAEQERARSETPVAITALEAESHLHCHRLAARISDLKAAGVAIDSELVNRDGARFSRYRLAPKPTTGVQTVAFPITPSVSPLRGES